MEIGVTFRIHLKTSSVFLKNFSLSVNRITDAPQLGIRVRVEREDAQVKSSHTTWHPETSGPRDGGGCVVAPVLGGRKDGGQASRLPGG